MLAESDYAEWRGPPRRTILICTQQRSGSTLLGEAVYFAGGLGCPVEYFHRGFQPTFAKRWETNDIRDYVASLYRFRTDPSGVLSIKLFWRDLAELISDLRESESASLLSDGASHVSDAAYRQAFATVSGVFPRPAFVFLTRRDTIRQAVSLAVAGQTGAWRRFPEGRCRATPAYDFHQIVQELARIQNNGRHWTNFLRANELECHEIFYESLLDKYDETLRNLFRFLGRPDGAIVKPRLQRQANESSEEILRRFLLEFHQRAAGVPSPS